MADGLWSTFEQSTPVQAARGLWDSLMNSRSPASPIPTGKGVNPALLDNSIYPYSPSDGGMRLDRYREDEPGLNQWVRKYGDTLDQGSGTAPALPPSLLLGRQNADPRGELPSPQWLREYMRAKYLDVTKI